MDGEGDCGRRVRLNQRTMGGERRGGERRERKPKKKSCVEMDPEQKHLPPPSLPSVPPSSIVSLLPKPQPPLPSLPPPRLVAERQTDDERWCMLGKRKEERGERGEVLKRHERQSTKD